MTGAGYFDSHCHIDDRLPGGIDGCVDAARAAGVVGMVTVGCDAATSRTAIDVAARFPDVWATVGLHPHDASQGVSTILELLDTEGIVAVGECGLDYHYDHSPREIQRVVFAEQIQLAHERALPLVVHTRSAWQDTFDILDAEGMPSTTIFHCFTGGPNEARECLDRGGYLSFSGIVTFPSAGDVREAAVLCPLDRLLAETDSPYLAPVPHRGRPNQPALVGVVIESLAVTRGESSETVCEAVRRNATIAFSLAAS